MNREEKQAIKILKSFEPIDLFEGAIYLQALEKLTNLIEKLQKENEELKKSKITYEKIRDIQEKNKNIVDNNYIPKQKIKDKIEELNKAYEDSKDENGESEYYYPDYTISVLEELLESEE